MAKGFAAFVRRYTLAIQRRVPEPIVAAAASNALGRAVSTLTPAHRRRLYRTLHGRMGEDECSLEYGVALCLKYRRIILAHKHTLAGLRMLEIGPGCTLVSALLFCAFGVDAYVASDLVPGADLESELYRDLRRTLEHTFAIQEDAAARADMLRRFDDAVDLSLPNVVLNGARLDYRTPVDAAKMPFPDGSFDVVLSHAAFEHFSDPASAVRECSRVLAPSGIGVHQIDLRDHRDFAKPWDFLFASDESWREMVPRQPYFMNRWRKGDFEAAFRSTDVELEAVDTNLTSALPPDVYGKLHPSFRERPMADLETLSALFVVRKGGRG